MKAAARPDSRQEEARQGVRLDANCWIARADRLLRAYQNKQGLGGGAISRLEALRHRRDTLAIKLAAFEQYARGGHLGRREDVLLAGRDLKLAWRMTVRSLERAAA